MNLRGDLWKGGVIHESGAYLSKKAVIYRVCPLFLNVGIAEWNCGLHQHKKISNQLSLTFTYKWWWFCPTVNKGNRQFPPSTLIWSSRWRTSRLGKHIPDRTATTPEMSLNTLIQFIIQHCVNAQAGSLLEYDEIFQIRRMSLRQFNSVHIFVTSQWDIPISINALRAD
jgi:hypothetical protein